MHFFNFHDFHMEWVYALLILRGGVGRNDCTPIVLFKICQLIRRASMISITFDYLYQVLLAAERL